MLTPTQCRMARAGLRWTILQLSHRAKVSHVTISRFEIGRVDPIPATLTVLRQTFEGAGVEFLDGDEPGVKLRARS